MKYNSENNFKNAMGGDKNLILFPFSKQIEISWKNIHIYRIG